MRDMSKNSLRRTLSEWPKELSKASRSAGTASSYFSPAVARQAWSSLGVAGSSSRVSLRCAPNFGGGSWLAGGGTGDGELSPRRKVGAPEGRARWSGDGVVLPARGVPRGVPSAPGPTRGVPTGVRCGVPAGVRAGVPPPPGRKGGHVSLSTVGSPAPGAAKSPLGFASGSA